MMKIISFLLGYNRIIFYNINNVNCDNNNLIYWILALTIEWYSILFNQRDLDLKIAPLFRKF